MTSALSFKLSESDSALFRELQDAALLSTLITPAYNEIASLVIKKKGEQERDITEPYADVIFPVLLQRIKITLEESLADLREAAKKGEPLDIPSLWWNTVRYDESLTEKKRRESTLPHAERLQLRNTEYDRREGFQRDGSEHMVGVARSPTYGYDEDSEDYSLWPIKVERILRFSDLMYRLAMALGPNFFPMIQWEEQVKRVEGVGSYSVWRKQLVFRFYPFGLDKGKMTTILDAYKRQKQREAEGKIRTLASYEWVDCQAGEWARPPLATRTNGGGIGAPVTLLGDAGYVYRSEADGIHAYPLPMRSNGGGIEACEDAPLSPPRLERYSTEVPGAPRKKDISRDLIAALNEAAASSMHRCFCGCSEDEE